MKIPRLRRRDPEFRRRGAPPPAARRFLAASLSAGLILLAALAVVFLPIALQHEQLPPVPRVVLEVVSGSSGTLVVVNVTLDRSLSAYRVEFYWDNDAGTTLKAAIDPLQNAATPFLSFRDVDGDGQLSAEDEFDLVISPEHRNRFLIIYVPAGRIVGGWPLGS